LGRREVSSVETDSVRSGGLVTFFAEYARPVFNAYAEEHLLITDKAPQDFIQFLRSDLISNVWTEFGGESRFWLRIIEESLTLSNFQFPRIPGRSVRKEEFLFPRGRPVIETSLKQHIDEQWVGKSWDHLEHAVAEHAVAGEPLDGQAELSAARRAVVMPLLEARGWTRNKWVDVSGVGKNSVYKYLDGSRALSSENRKAMAESIGLDPDQLPD
jgi:hypothetical protein